MADRIIEVHSITAAPIGWRVASGRFAGRRVVCFALVTTTNGEHPGMLNERRIIPITEVEVDRDLLGNEVEEFGPELAFDGD